MADSALKDTPPPNQSIDLTPVTYPPALAHLVPVNSTSDLVQLISCQKTAEKTRQAFIEAVPPPTMIHDPMPNFKPEASNYVAVPPFAQLNGEIPGFKKVDHAQAKEQVMQRLGVKEDR